MENNVSGEIEDGTSQRVTRRSIRIRTPPERLGIEPQPNETSTRGEKQCSLVTHSINDSGLTQEQRAMTDNIPEESTRGDDDVNVDDTESIQDNGGNAINTLLSTSIHDSGNINNFNTTTESLMQNDCANEHDSVVLSSLLRITDEDRALPATTDSLNLHPADLARVTNIRLPSRIIATESTSFSIPPNVNTCSKLLLQQLELDEEIIKQEEQIALKRIELAKRKRALLATMIKEQQLINVVTNSNTFDDTARGKVHTQDKETLPSSLPKVFSEVNALLSSPPEVDTPFVMNQAHLPSHHHTDMNTVPTSTSNNTMCLQILEKYHDIVKTTLQRESYVPENSNRELNHMLARQTANSKFYFSGKPEEWPTFIRRFENLCESCGFTDLEKIEKLDRCLQDEARESVASLLGFPENLPIVLKTLKQTFGRSSQIANALLVKVHNAVAPKESKPETMISFVNVVRNVVTTIQALKMPGHLNNSCLLDQLILKLPMSYQHQWGLAVARKQLECNEEFVPNLIYFADWLEEVRLAVSFIPQKTSTTWNTENDYTRNNSKGKPMYSTSAATRNCDFCKQDNHEPFECKRFVDLNVDERWNLVKVQKVCHLCLHAGHHTSRCSSKTHCGVDGCKYQHHAMLHQNFRTPSRNPAFRDSTFQPGNEAENLRGTFTQNPIFCTQGSTTAKSKVFLKIIPVTLSGPLGKINTYALLDDASSVTLVDANISSRLGLCGPKTSLCLQWTNKTTRHESDSMLVSLDVQGTHVGSKLFKIHNAHTMKNLGLTSQTVDMKALRQRWPYLNNIPFNSIVNAVPTILIGQNNHILLNTSKTVNSSWNAPSASKTLLGWVIHGNTELYGKVDTEFTYHVCDSSSSDSELHDLVKTSFATESFGVKVVHESWRSREDKQALALMKSSTRRVEEEWETGLLWRDGTVYLPNSKPQALRRLDCVENKMDNDPTYAKAYNDKIEDLISKSYVRKLSPSEAAVRDRKMWYLPHFAVVNPNKPGKIRVVFDAAAKSAGVSLNDFFLTGIDLLLPLQTVLYNFRQRRIAFLGDIKEMFLRVSIRAEDQHAQRFLWRGFDRVKEPEVYVITRVLFGAASSPTSAQFVKNLNAEEFQTEFPEASNAILKHHYMDDWLESTDTEAEAIKLIQEVIKVHQKGGFEICNFICNSKTVLKQIPPHLRGKELDDANLDSELPMERVLGLWWDSGKDVFTFKLNFHKVDPAVINANRVPSKREVLKVVMAVFDPLGFLAHFIIKAKILLQDIWRSLIGWDDPLTPKLNETWMKWLNELYTITSIQIPRCYGTNFSSSDKVELHLFCDASEKAFAAVGYFRVLKFNTIQTAFVTARTRVAPLNPLSIPKLELQAALTACRLAQAIKSGHEITIHETYFWTDARNVLCWLHSDARQFKQFVAHRLGEILECTSLQQWHWVPTKENVADDATRDVGETDFSLGNRWWSGPAFLSLDSSEWPQMPPNFIVPVKDDDQERKKEFVYVTLRAVHTLPDIERFSSWKRLVRTTALVFRYKQVLLARVRDLSYPAKKLDIWKVGTQIVLNDELTVDELKQAERIWILDVQQMYFYEEIADLKASRPIKKSSSIYKLTPILDDEVVRMQGRLESSILPLETKSPFILDPRHRYTRLLVQEYHSRFNHQGSETVMNELRQTYWILNLRTAVKTAQHNCRWCKVKKCMPQQPLMGQLPQCRVIPQTRAFIYTGMDYFGPLEVTVKTRKERRYGVIFTCMTTRAVHLDLAHSLTTDSAIMAIRRFTARRGYPKAIFSDNGSNLSGAERELRQAINKFDDSHFKRELAMKNIEWNFNPPLTPHMGGSWERLIRSIKTSLRVTLKARAPKEEVLLTLLHEAEHIVNCRPLTLVSNDNNDIECLTPFHFLCGSSSAVFSPGVFTDTDLRLGKLWRISQRLSDMFWARWVKEYLPTLLRRSKWFANPNSIKKDDLVIIVDPCGQRNTWPMGRVESLFPGKDGVVRVVDVRTNTGVYRRSVTRLCVLDIESDDKPSSGGKDVSTPSP